MKRSTGSGLAGIVLTAFLCLANAQQATAALTPEEAQAIAVDAYIYGYSLVTTEVTRVQMSNVPEVEQIRAPMGTFFNVPGYPPATYRGSRQPMPTRCTRWRGWTCPNPRCSAIHKSTNASLPLSWSTCG